MRPSVRRLEENFQGQVDFYELNVDEAATTPLADQYNVAGIPTVILLNADGSTFRRMEGFQTEDQLTAAVNDLLKAQK